MDNNTKQAIVRQRAFMDRLMVEGEFDQLAALVTNLELPTGTRVYARSSLKCCWSRIVRSGLQKKYRNLVDE